MMLYLVCVIDAFENCFVVYQTKEVPRGTQGHKGNAAATEVGKKKMKKKKKQQQHKNEKSKRRKTGNNTPPKKKRAQGKPAVPAE